MSRTIAIGDIHGCEIALASILELIEPSEKDSLIQLGDAIDRGPNARQVISQLLELKQVCQFHFIQGNHEEMMLDSLDDDLRASRWLNNGGDMTLKSYGIESLSNWHSEIPETHVELIRKSEPYVETDSFIFTHAGYEPNVPMAQQNELALRWRVCHRDTAEPHFSNKTVVVGHTVQRSGEILDLGCTICIDTNCCRGGWLTALDVGSGLYWQADQAGKTRMGKLESLA